MAISGALLDSRTTLDANAKRELSGSPQAHLIEKDTDRDPLGWTGGKRAVTNAENDSMSIAAANENERIALEFFSSLSTANLTSLGHLLDSDATWSIQAPSLPIPLVHNGRKGIIEDFMGSVAQMFKSGGPQLSVTSIASNGPLVMLEARGLGELAD